MSSVTDRLSAAIAPRAAALQQALQHPLRDERTAVVLGRLLGVAFLVCFVTGAYSHLLQDPWDPLPTFPRPVYLYGWTQGVHVVAGTALIPLLLAKLWTVFPKLFAWPPVRSLPHLLERLALALLVATALMEPVTGILNALQWYPWDFSFRRTHFALAWILMGAMAVHVAVHLPVIVRAWRRPRDDEGEPAREDES